MGAAPGAAGPWAGTVGRKEPSPCPISVRNMQNQYDVIIIGAGAVGCAIARELSFYDLKICVLEKEADVAAGTSGRNSAVVHAGFNNKPGSLMAKLCVAGNEGMEALCRQLDVPYEKTGKVLVAFDAEDEAVLQGLVAQGEQNGCRGLRLIRQEELEKLVPGVGGIGGMLSPETAILDPFKYGIALAENAAANGVVFRFEEEALAAVEYHLVGYLFVVFEFVFWDVADADVGTAEFGHSSGVDPVSAVIFFAEHYQHVILGINFLVEESSCPYIR